MMNYKVAIGVMLSLNDSEKQYDDDTVLDAVEKILSMETINATPKDALLNALRWFWDKTVEEVEPKDCFRNGCHAYDESSCELWEPKNYGKDINVPTEPYDLLYEEGGPDA